MSKKTKKISDRELRARKRDATRDLLNTREEPPEVIVIDDSPDDGKHPALRAKNEPVESMPVDGGPLSVPVDLISCFDEGDAESRVAKVDIADMIEREEVSFDVKFETPEVPSVAASSLRKAQSVNEFCVSSSLENITPMGAMSVRPKHCKSAVRFDDHPSERCRSLDDLRHLMEVSLENPYGELNSFEAVSHNDLQNPRSGHRRCSNLRLSFWFGGFIAVTLIVLLGTSDLRHSPEPEISNSTTPPSSTPEPPEFSTTPTPPTHPPSPPGRVWRFSLRGFDCQLGIRNFCYSDERGICIELKGRVAAGPDVVLAIRVDMPDTVECEGYEAFVEV